MLVIHVMGNYLDYVSYALRYDQLYIMKGPKVVKDLDTGNTKHASKQS